jgi:outer membrane murein-binding lipoprotein Lpp
MATATAKKPRTSVEAVPQLALLPERVGVVETKVEHLNEKMDELKADVKEMHDCLDNTRNGIMGQLEKMHQASCDQHNELAGKVKDLEKVKNKFTMYAMAALAFAAGTGWLNSVSFPHILKFLGL